jgi:hypothetical protein
MNNWTDTKGIANVWLSDLPTGVSTTPGGDAYGYHQYISAWSNAVPGQYVVTVNGSTGGANPETHVGHLLLNITAAPPPPPPPGSPGCYSVASTCDAQFIPAANGTPGHYQTVESVTTTTCVTTPNAMQQLVNGQWVAVPRLNENLSYPNVTPNKFEVGVQTDQGRTTSGAPVGSVLTVKACNTNAGGTTCDYPTTITVKDCCTPMTCTSTMCGTQSDGCGGTISCTAGCNNTCVKKNCPAGQVWNSDSCDCEAKCSTPKECCIAGGGDWVGGHCI